MGGGAAKAELRIKLDPLLLGRRMRILGDRRGQARMVGLWSWDLYFGWFEAFVPSEVPEVLELYMSCVAVGE